MSIKSSVIYFHGFQLFVEVLIEITSLVCTNSTKVRVHEAAKLIYMIKSKRFYRFPGARSCDFCRIANIVFNKGKLAILSLFHCPGVLLSACGKAKLIGEVFSEDSNLDDSGVSFPAFLLFLLF